MTINDPLIFSATRTPATPPKPPDNGENGKTPLSFRDKLLGNKRAVQPKERMDLIQQGLVKIDHVDGNRLLPRVQIESKLFDDLCDPWREALVIKLLGKNVGFTTMKSKLASTWKLGGGFELMDVDNGFYMVKFDLADDREKVINGGPWMFFDHYLAVANWSPDFVSSTAKIEKTLVWVRFPGMNLVYYDENILMAMASAIGNPVKVDQRTLSVDRGRFARVCVEIDLNLPVVAQIWVRGAWHKVAYEGLHVICNSCGCYGHVTRNCTSPVTPSASYTTTTFKPGEEQVAASAGGTTISSQVENLLGSFEGTTKPDAIHGDWITVTKKKRTNKGVVNKNEGNNGNFASHGNRFLSLGKEIQENDFLGISQMESNDKGVIGGDKLTPKVWTKKRQRTNLNLSTTLNSAVNRTNPISSNTRHATNQVQPKSHKGQGSFQHGKNGPAKTNPILHSSGNKYELLVNNKDVNNSILSQPVPNTGKGSPCGTVINTLSDKVDHEIHNEGSESGSLKSNVALKLNDAHVHEKDVDMEAT